MPQPIPGSTTQITTVANASTLGTLSSLAKAAPRVLIVNNTTSTVYLRFGIDNSVAATVADIPIPPTTNNPALWDKPIGWGYAALWLPSGGNVGTVNLTGVDGFQ